MSCHPFDEWCYINIFWWMGPLKGIWWVAASMSCRFNELPLQWVAASMSCRFNELPLRWAAAPPHKPLEAHWAFTSPATMNEAAICLFTLGSASGNAAANPKKLHHLNHQHHRCQWQTQHHNLRAHQEWHQLRRQRTTTTTEPLEATTPFRSKSLSPRSIKTCSRKNPEEGERYRKRYICKFCNYLI